MATQQPQTTVNPQYSSPGATPVPWEEASDELAKAEIFWLVTVRPEVELNVTAGDNDFLIRPELIGTATGQPVDRYFRQPTPGAVNAGGALGLSVASACWVVEFSAVGSTHKALEVAGGMLLLHTPTPSGLSFVGIALVIIGLVLFAKQR